MFWDHVMLGSWGCNMGWYTEAYGDASIIEILFHCPQDTRPMAASRDTPAPSELDIVLTGGIELLKLLVPDWEPPVLEHPNAVQYKSLVQLLYDIVPGDQVMVKAVSGYYHHGIFVGKQNVEGTSGPAVVDFWGGFLLDKEDAAIGVRTLDDFGAGATGFAKADYPQGAALEHEQSVIVAMKWVEREQMKRTIYNVALKNCEVFATICRCGRYAEDGHDALVHKLMDLPAMAPAPFRKGFK